MENSINKAGAVSKKCDFDDIHLYFDLGDYSPLFKDYRNNSIKFFQNKIESNIEEIMADIKLMMLYRIRMSNSNLSSMTKLKIINIVLRNYKEMILPFILKTIKTIRKKAKYSGGEKLSSLPILC